MRNCTSLLLLIFLCSAGYWNLVIALPIASDTSQLQASHYIRFFKPRYHRPKPVVVMLPDIQDADDYNYVDGEIYPAGSAPNDRIVRTGGLIQNTASLNQQLPELNDETAGSFVKDIQALLQKYGVDAVAEQKGFANAKYSIEQTPSEHRYMLPLIHVDTHINNINIGNITNVFSALTNNTSLKESPEHILNTTYSENKVETPTTTPVPSTAASKTIEELLAGGGRRMLEEDDISRHSESVAFITTATPDYSKTPELYTSHKQDMKQTTTNMPFSSQTYANVLQNDDVIQNKMPMINQQTSVMTTEIAIEKEDVTDVYVSTTSTPKINDYVAVKEASTSSSTLEQGSDDIPTSDSSANISNTIPTDIEFENSRQTGTTPGVLYAIEDKPKETTTRVVEMDKTSAASSELPSEQFDIVTETIVPTTQTSYDVSEANIINDSFESDDTTSVSPSTVTGASLFSTDQNAPELHESHQPGTTTDVSSDIPTQVVKTDEIYAESSEQPDIVTDTIVTTTQKNFDESEANMMDDAFESDTTTIYPSTVISDSLFWTDKTDQNDIEFEDDSQSETTPEVLHMNADDGNDITTHVVGRGENFEQSSEQPDVVSGMVAQTTQTTQMKQMNFDESEANIIDDRFDDTTAIYPTTITSYSLFSTEQNVIEFEDGRQLGTDETAAASSGLPSEQTDIDIATVATTTQMSFDDFEANIMNVSFESDDSITISPSSVTGHALFSTEVVEDKKIDAVEKIQTTTITSYDSTVQDYEIEEDVIDYSSERPSESVEMNEEISARLFDFSNITTTNDYTGASEASTDLYTIDKHEVSVIPDSTETPIIATMLNTVAPSYTMGSMDTGNSNFRRNLFISDISPTAVTENNVNEDNLGKSGSHFTTKHYIAEDTSIENGSTEATTKEMVSEKLDIEHTGESDSSVTFDQNEDAYTSREETTLTGLIKDNSGAPILTTMTREGHTMINDAVTSSEQSFSAVDEETSTSDYVTQSSYQLPMRSGEIEPTYKQMAESERSTTMSIDYIFSTLGIFANDSEESSSITLYTNDEAAVSTTERQRIDLNEENEVTPDGKSEVTQEITTEEPSKVTQEENLTFSNTELRSDSEIIPTENTFVTDHDSSEENKLDPSTGATTSSKYDLQGKIDLNTEPSHDIFEDDVVGYTNYAFEITKPDALNVVTEYVENTSENKEEGNVTYHYDKESKYVTEHSIISTFGWEDSSIPLVSFTSNEELSSHNALANQEDKKDLALNTSESITEEQPDRVVIETITSISETLVNVKYATTFEPGSENQESNLEDRTIDNKYITNEALLIEDTSLYTTISDHNTTKRDDGLAETDKQRDVDRKAVGDGRSTTKSPSKEDTLKALLQESGGRRFVSPVSDPSSEDAEDDADKPIDKDNLNTSEGIFAGKSGSDYSSKTSFKLSTDRTKPQKFHEDGLYIDPGQASTDYETTEEGASAKVEKVDPISMNESEQSSSPRVRRTFTSKYLTTSPHTFYLMNTQENIQNDQLKDIPQEQIHIKKQQREEKRYRDPMIQRQEGYYNEHDQDLHQTTSSDAYTTEEPSIQNIPHTTSYVNETQSLLSVMETSTVPQQNDSFENMTEATTSRII